MIYVEERQTDRQTKTDRLTGTRAERQRLRDREEKEDGCLTKQLHPPDNNATRRKNGLKKRRE